MDILGLSFVGSKSELLGKAAEIAVEVAKQSNIAALMFGIQQLIDTSPTGNFQNLMKEKLKRYEELTGINSALTSGTFGVLGGAARVRASGSKMAMHADELIHKYSEKEYNYMSNRDKLATISKRLFEYVQQESADIELAYPAVSQPILTAVYNGQAPLKA